MARRITALSPVATRPPGRGRDRRHHLRTCVHRTHHGPADDDGPTLSVRRNAHHIGARIHDLLRAPI
ncbi:hypothetical protein [Streptomyces sp. NPDC048551]|uniref:hypothetical protein n=1 Tax=Streptomyces sp. NPDC048551 TaxID=3155758 RepID=UPI0034267A5F